MKKVFTILLLVLFAHAGVNAIPKYVQAQLFYSKFLSPQDGPYLETYISVVGNSLKYVPVDDGNFQGKLEVTMIFSKDGNVVNYDKYELLSPVIDDTANVSFNFLDQQRFSLPNGMYDYEIRISDLNSDVPPFTTTQTIEIDFPENEVAISGIQLVESYEKSAGDNILTKSGYDLVPYVYNFLPDDVNMLTFYAEVYNTSRVFGEDEKYLVNYFVESYETGKRLNSFNHFKREKAGPVNVIFANFNINSLPSGNYYLVIEARDRQNELIAGNKLFFQRSNPDVELNYDDYASSSVASSFVDEINNRDTLLMYIGYLEPISTDVERKFVSYQIEQNNGDVELMQRYFLNFWLDRDDLNPEHAWRQYLSAVELVNEQFGSPGKRGKPGYETDMGRVYLMYGPPNTITDVPFDASTSGMTLNDGGGSAADPGTVPYQIWHYYTLDNLRNRKFVFANKHLATFDYELIHSNMPGEISNANWQAELHWRFQHDATLPDRDKYRGKSGDLYNNPR